MDLRRLEYFLAVVEHGQVTSAASALRVAQPSLSQAIKALERDLGVQLFTREGRTLRPTGAGQALIEPARQVLGDLDTARAAVADVVEVAAGWLDVAAHDLLGRDPLVPALAAFHDRYDGIPVRVHSPRDEDDLVRMLADGRCELGLTFLPVPDAGLTVRRLGAQEVWVVLPPGSRAPRRADAPIAVSQLQDVTIVDSTRGFASLRAAIAAALREEKVLIRPVVRTRHRESIIPMVLRGVGGTFTTSAYARQAARAGAVARRLEPSVTCDFALVHRDATLSPAARAFVRVLLDVVGGRAEPADHRAAADQPKRAGQPTHPKAAQTDL
jgi:DNA-binding transcriptional LysR family regulator